MWLTILGIVAILYGIFTLYITWVKPPALWGIAKIQAFVSLLSLRGTEIFFSVFAVAMIALGLWLVL
jgi:hypothetical protein